MTPESYQPEQSERREREAPLALDALPAQLGLIETPVMTDVREKLVEIGVQDSGAARELDRHFNLLGIAVAEQYTGAAFAKAQIGLTIAMGLNRRDTDRLDEYREDLEAARMYADYEDLVAVVETLDAALAKENQP